MPYISTRKTRLKTQLARTQAILNDLYNLIGDAALSGVVSYEFDSGEGRQRTTRYSLKELMDTISRLEATEMRLINELSNMGLMTIALRRKMPC